jgi:NAD(P)-dependent dehydrogenase (short-subunit alcohol dehydrogenase family)
MKTKRTVVVTGAGGGIGSLIVKRFVQNEDTVIATDNSERALEGLSFDLGAERLQVVVADITRDLDCQRVAECAQKTTGRVDVLVNVAGFFPVQPFEQMSSEDWRRVVDINLTGTALMTKAMLPLMKGRGWGRVINIGSASIYKGVPVQVHYVAAKAGVIGMSRSLAREYGGERITVNVVAPGLTITPAAAQGLPKELQEAQIGARCIRRAQQPEDLVGPTFFLASPDADFITGQTLIVDGGLHMI